MTLPVPSKPQTEGSFLSKHAPSTRSLSEGFIVEASTLIKTSPFLGYGIGIVLIVGVPPYYSSTNAFWS